MNDHTSSHLFARIDYFKRCNLPKANTELLIFETNFGVRDWQAWIRNVDNKYQLDF